MNKLEDACKMKKYYLHPIPAIAVSDARGGLDDIQHHVCSGTDFHNFTKTDEEVEFERIISYPHEVADENK